MIHQRPFEPTPTCPKCHYNSVKMEHCLKVEGDVEYEWLALICGRCRFRWKMDTADCPSKIGPNHPAYLRVGDRVKVVSTENRQYNLHIKVNVGDEGTVVEGGIHNAEAVQVNMGSNGCGALDRHILRKVYPPPLVKRFNHETKQFEEENEESD